ncbi:hypothetical protein CXF68_14975 [Tenacibaculum sp. Bg11-29]|uniref:hypothetical protein n=1 Tax=Tenacibaculum sp. Bg11-29 TaxID=2058306 RepID=UPI000C342BBA|nr:hypothetical protein [Tenacibaculum sp. Bg11-29]PKH51910.1 hypothetical protein CXF68_14975 [Tenacibaculum sp. Bg11-29]
MDNRGRFQAQGNGLERSEPWNTNLDVNKQDGQNLITDLRNQLSNRELNERVNAFVKAENFVHQSPSNGHSVIGQSLIIKTFPNSPQNRSIRVDVEIRAGIAFIDN